MAKKHVALLMGFICVLLAGVAVMGQVSIDYWHFYGGDFGRVHEEAIAEFNATHPDIQVTSQYIGSAWTGRDKLLTAIAAGSAPDICLVDDYWIPELAATGNILKLGDHITANTAFDVFDLFWQSARYKGEIWAMPYAASNLVLYYNKDMFIAAGLDPEAPPTTWGELVDYAKTLTKDLDGDGQIDQWGLMMNTTSRTGVIYDFLPYLWQNGGELFNEDCTECTIDSDEAVESLQYLQDLIYVHEAMPAAPPKNGYRTGVVAMTFASCARLHITYEPVVEFDMGVAAHVMNDEKLAPVTVAGGKLFTVFNNEKLAAEMVFINWMTNVENNTAWSMATGYIPLRHAVVDSEEFQAYLDANPNAKPAIAQIPYTRARPNIAAYGDISRVIGNAIESALLGQQDPAAVFTNAVPEANQVLLDWEERLQ